jgi:hypothetical protein
MSARPDGMSTESCTEFPIDIRTRPSYFLIFPRRHRSCFSVLDMTIDTRTPAAPCGIAISSSCDCATAARYGSAPSARSRAVPRDVLATNLQQPTRGSSGFFEDAWCASRGTSLAARKSRIITRQRLRCTRAALTARLQIVFDIHHHVPEHVRLLRSVSARRSHEAALTRHTAARRSDLRRMRGDWK